MWVKLCFICRLLSLVSVFTLIQGRLPTVKTSENLPQANQACGRIKSPGYLLVVEEVSVILVDHNGTGIDRLGQRNDVGSLIIGHDRHRGVVVIVQQLGP
jgi:hypothetical protein